MMGDPYVGTEILKGKFTIFHYGGSNWRWTKNLTFVFLKENENIYLESIEESSFNVLEADSEKIDDYIEKNTKKLTSKDFGKVKFSDYHDF